MSTLTCIETSIQEGNIHYGCFIIEPLDTGHAITLGNALRRTLLSDLTSFSIVGVRINKLKHEFATIPGLREDVLELLFNLKEIVFKSSILTEQKKLTKLKGFLHIQGPRILTAGMFHLPKDIIQIVNPNHYIGTLVDKSELYIEIDIENGKGYKLTEEIRKNRLEEKMLHGPSTIILDALFMPVKKVNYKTKIINDTKGILKESLILEIWTNGSITPRRALHESLKILMNLFYPLFINPTFLSISTELLNQNKN